MDLAGPAQKPNRHTAHALLTRKPPLATADEVHNQAARRPERGSIQLPSSPSPVPASPAQNTAGGVTRIENVHGIKDRGLLSPT